MPSHRATAPPGSPPVNSVLFTVDGKYAQHAAACIASLLQHSRAKLDIVVASSGDPETFAERLRRSFAGNERVSLEFRQFQLPPAVDFPTTALLTTEMYIRFWAHLLLPGRARTVYLDPDIIAVGPVDELWTTDLEGRTLGAVPIPNSIRVAQHGLPPGSLYFNSGVLLMDLPAWARGGYSERCIRFIRDHRDQAFDPDQDALNLVLRDDWTPLAYKWNVINPFYRPSPAHDLGLPPGEIAQVRADARLVHFNSRHKPWVYLDNHPMQPAYFRALAQTDWRGWRPADRTPLNVIRKQISAALPPWLKARARALLKRAG